MLTLGACSGHSKHENLHCLDVLSIIFANTVRLEAVGSHGGAINFVVWIILGGCNVMW
jgi:hypothetical protein